MARSAITRVYEPTTEGFKVAFVQQPLNAGEVDRFYVSTDWFFADEAPAKGTLVKELAAYVGSSFVEIRGLDEGRQFCLRVIRYNAAGAKVYHWNEGDASPDPYREGNCAFNAFTAAKYEYVPLKADAGDPVAWDMSRPTGEVSGSNWVGISITQHFREYDADFGGFTVGTKGGVGNWCREWHGMFRPYMHFDPEHNITIEFDIKLKRPISGWSVCFYHAEDYYTGVKNPNGLGPVYPGPNFDPGNICYWFDDEPGLIQRNVVPDDTLTHIKMEYLKDTPSAGSCTLNGYANGVLGYSSVRANAKMELPIGWWLTLFANQSGYQDMVHNITPASSYVKIGNFKVYGEPVWAAFVPSRYQMGWKDWYDRGDIGNPQHTAILFAFDCDGVVPLPGATTFRDWITGGVVAESKLPDMRPMWEGYPDETDVALNNPMYNWWNQAENLRTQWGKTIATPFSMTSPLIAPNRNGKRYSRLHVAGDQGLDAGDYMKVFVRYRNGSLVEDAKLVVLSPAARVGQVNSTGFRPHCWDDLAHMVIDASAVDDLVYIDVQANRAVDGQQYEAGKQPTMREVWMTFQDDPGAQLFYYTFDVKQKQITAAPRIAFSTVAGPYGPTRVIYVEDLAVTAAAAASVADVKVFYETMLQAFASSSVTVVDLQNWIEGLDAAVAQATATAEERQTYVEEVAAQAATVATAEELQTYYDGLMAVVVGAASADVKQQYIDDLTATATIAAAVDAQQQYRDEVQAGGEFSAAVGDLQQYDERLEADAQAQAAVEDRALYTEVVQAVGDVQAVADVAAQYVVDVAAQAQATASAEDLQQYAERLQTDAQITAAVGDQEIYRDDAVAIGEFAAAVTDEKLAIEDLKVDVASQATVADLQAGIEQPSVTAQATAAVDVVQQMIDNLQAVVASAATVEELQVYAESLSVLVQSAVTMDELAGILETLTVAAGASATVEDYMRFVDGVVAVCQATASVDDAQAFIDALLAIGQGTATVDDMITFVDDLLVQVGSEAQATDRQTYDERVTAAVGSEATVTDETTGGERVEAVGQFAATVEDRQAFMDDVIAHAQGAATVDELQAYVDSVVAQAFATATVVDRTAQDITIGVGSRVPPRSFEAFARGRSFTSACVARSFETKTSTLEAH